jgi:exosortase H (IPTLxxWG-CTERM-specific)
MSRQEKTPPPSSADATADPFWPRWWAGKKPLLRFGAAFVVLIALFSGLSLAPFVQRFVADNLRFDARLASTVLNWFGQRAHNSGDTISSSRFAVTVLSECSADEFVIFLWAGLLAFPTTVRRKAVGLVLGTLCIQIVNLARIVTLFLVGAYRPNIFATVHEELWPGLFIIATVLFVAGWAMWATRSEQIHASN